MIIDISDLNGKKVTEKKLQLTLEVNKICDGTETYDVVEPMVFNGMLKSVGDIINLNGALEAKLKLACSRCLQKFDYSVDIEIHEKFTTNPENRDDEVIFIDNEKLDITEIVENTIILSLPIKKLCSEDCKGLCQSCGANLNSSTCKCKNDDTDPRLAKLKELFSND
ncbi:MAG: DUF177 domain-containing protein [Bacillota bacterium]|nr:DUF177 domain-containing protein [Bacillota bacterium]